jgi:hypothetical protein
MRTPWISLKGCEQRGKNALIDHKMRIACLALIKHGAGAGKS